MGRMLRHTTQRIGANIMGNRLFKAGSEVGVEFFPHSRSSVFAFPGRRSAIPAGVSVPSCARKRFSSFSQPSS